MHCYYIYWNNCLYATSVCFSPSTTVALYFSDYNIALGIGIKASGEYTWLNSKQVFFKLTQQNILDLKNILVLAERIKTLVSISYHLLLLFSQSLICTLFIISAAYMCHHNTFPVHGFLAKPTEQRWTLVPHLSMAFHVVHVSGNSGICVHYRTNKGYRFNSI